jgi:ATP-dependent Clp protease ATP-binding subunit ClpA
MFERSNQEARTVVAEAQIESRERRQHHVGPEHFLVGLLRENRSGAAEFLRSRGVSLERVRELLVEAAGVGEHIAPPRTRPPFTPRAAKVIELSVRAAVGQSAPRVGPEHILLGIALEGDNVAIRILLEEWGLSLQKIQEFVAIPAHLPRVVDPGEAAAEDDRSDRAERSPRIEPSVAVRRLLMAAAAVALDDGRTAMQIDDVWTAVTSEPSAARLAAQLEIADNDVRAAIARRRGSKEPPAASAPAST